MTTRRAFALGIVAALVLLPPALGHPLLGGLAEANPTKKLKGQIIISEEPLPTDLSEKGVVDELKAKHQTTLKKKKNDTWSFHFMGFLKTKAGASSISLVFYDVTGKRTYTTSKDISIDPSATTVVSEVEFSEDDGLKIGNKYEVVLARKVGAKEIIYARTKVSLK